MSSTAALYSPEVLGLATALARFPLSDDLLLVGSARSPVCGSAIELGLGVDDAGRISRVGMRCHACAIGQASAALFAQAAPGRTRDDIAGSLDAIEHWLRGAAAALPDWPGLEAIAPAQAYPARHGAIVLAWKAALAALP